jgi:hypothetical protein
VEQDTLTPSGERTQKLRLTHDQSFSILEGSESLNSITDTSVLPPLLYGHTIRRIIYQTLALRWHHPDTPILCSKFEFGNAYRRVNYDGVSAERSTAIHDGIGYLLLRLSFGGTSCPYSWCPIGELISDLANDLLSDPSWEPDQEIKNSTLPTLDPVRHPVDTPISDALPTMILPPDRPEGSVDIYVDDAILPFLDTERNFSRAPQAFATATAFLSRPIAEIDPLPREAMISLNKYTAEGAPS